MVQPDGISPLILFMVASLQPTILIVLRWLQVENMYFMPVTLLISQPLKSKEVRDRQLVNM